MGLQAEESMSMSQVYGAVIPAQWCTGPRRYYFWNGP